MLNQESKGLTECFEQAKAYLRGDTEVERGGLITKDGQFIPFDNCADNPTGLIEIGTEEIKIVTKLLREDNLYGWIHSHPHSPAYPSIIDITRHDMPINMLIYSIQDDMLNVFSSAYIQEMAAGICDGSNWDRGKKK